MAASVEKLLPCLVHFKMRGLAHRSKLFYFALFYFSGSASNAGHGGLIPVFGKLKQGEASLDYTVRPCLYQKGQQRIKILIFSQVASRQETDQQDEPQSCYCLREGGRSCSAASSLRLRSGGFQRPAGARQGGSVLTESWRQLRGLQQGLMDLPFQGGLNKTQKMRMPLNPSVRKHKTLISVAFTLNQPSPNPWGNLKTKHLSSPQPAQTLRSTAEDLPISVWLPP